MNRDFVTGLIGRALAIGYHVVASNIASGQLADEVGPDGLPRIYAWMLGGLSLILSVRALQQRASAATTAGDVSEVHAAWRALGILLIAGAYVAAVPVLGYPLTIAFVIGVAALYQGGRVSWPLALISVSGAAALWFVFVYLLHIAQPEGIWPDLIERMRA